MKRLLGDEYISLEKTYTQEAPVGLRANSLKITPEQLQRLSPYRLTPLTGITSGFLVTVGEQPGKHPYHAAGLYYIQDPSAMVAAQLLDPQPGEIVLDLSAAPGGKSTQLIALMQDQGLLIANEIDSRRVWELAENLERWGTKNTIIANETPTHLAEKLPLFFDRILVDAPCSGEGMLGKSEAARQQWSPALIDSCAFRQQAILDEAARMLKPGGRLAYVTCTFAPEENETVTARFLQTHPDFELVEPALLPGFSTGRPEWLSGISEPAVRGAIRLWPQNWPGGGQFIALFQRAGTGEAKDQPPLQVKKLPSQARRLFESFQQATLVHFNPAGDLLQEGNYLYQISSLLPDHSGLHLIRPGWLVGELKKNRFEPSHALALGLNKNHSRRLLDLKADDRRILSYLQGDVLKSAGEDGWVLVCVDGFPLGWGKRVQGVIKNHYPRGLRWP